MAKRFYELLIAQQSGITAADTDALITRIVGIVQAAGGAARAIERPGIRPLAFKVKGKSDAAFLILTLEMPQTAVKEIEQYLRLHEGVLRYMTTRVPAAMIVAAAGQPA